jgi:hypothetical protein
MARGWPRELAAPRPRDSPIFERDHHSVHAAAWSRRPCRIHAITASREEPARYVNRYEKGALVFIGVERRFGWPRLQACLRRVLLDVRREPMTTERFLALVRDTIDGTAAGYVQMLIMAEGWTPALLASVPEEAHPN